MLKKAPLRARVLVLAARREKNPMFGKNRSDKSIQIEVTDLQEKTLTYYDSFSEAVKALNLPSHNVISNYIIRNQIKPYKARYTFKKI